MASLVKHPVKVVIINTEYVETDAMSFKSVVQKFTGKDSAPPPGISRDNKRCLKREFSMRMASMDEMRAKRVRLDADDKVSYGSGTLPVLMRDLSFKEFERLLKEMEMPTVDELYAGIMD